MSCKYDPPNKAGLLADKPRISSTVGLMVAAAEAQFPPKAKSDESTSRAARRKALKAQPTHQAKLVMWHLTTRVPLNFAAIPETEIKSACERFNLSLETWRRQERAFGLLRKVYAKRAAIRGQQAPSVPEWSQQFQDWPTDNETDEYPY